MGAPTPSVSKQDYGTPREFVDAVERRFGRIHFDLAAHAGNAVCENYLTVEDDSLKQPWHEIGGLLWLNPPFKQCTKFAAKCQREAMRGAHILFLVPSSVGSNWYWKHCAPFRVFPIAPRLVFDGSPPDARTGRPQPFMKDLMLVEFGPAMTPCFERWAWKEKASRKRREAA